MKIRFIFIDGGTNQGKRALKLTFTRREKMKKISGKFFRANPAGARRRNAPNKSIHMFILLLSTLIIAANAWAQGPVYQVGVDGLACPFCAYGIEKQLQKLDGVKAVEVDVKEGNVVVTMHDGKTLDQTQTEQAVKKAGFSLRSFVQPEETAP